jgi:hypothetical protein
MHPPPPPLHLHLGIHSGLLPEDFSNKVSCVFLICPNRVASPTNLVFLDFIALIIFGEEVNVVLGWKARALLWHTHVAGAGPDFDLLRSYTTSMLSLRGLKNSKVEIYVILIERNVKK